MDVPLYSDEEHKDNLRGSASSNNFSRVTQLTRKASKLLDQEKKTEIEISELLMKQGFSHEEVERVRSVGVKDIYHAIDLLTETGRPEVTGKEGLSCLICQAGDERVTLFGCDHVFCRDCLGEYLRLKVNEAQVLSIRCPQHRCATILAEEVVLKYLPPHSTDKYKRFRIKAELTKDPHLRWCPRADCEGYCLGSSSHKHLICSMCLHEYCYYCSQPWHGEAPCKEQADQLLDAWAKQNDVRYCPNCRFRVEKMMGCSHMACIQCQYQWCWLCGEHWTDGHFATCSEFKRWWQDPPLYAILLCLIAPFTMVFLNIFVILHLAMSLNEGEDNQLSAMSRNKCLSYSIIFLISLILSPICFIVFVVGLPIYLAVKTCTSCNCGWVANSAIILLMILYVFLFLLALVLGSVVLELGGVVMVGTKSFLGIRRCFVKQTAREHKYSAMW
jgi:hypothetical protein